VAEASAFDLPARRSAKADPELIVADEEHFAAIATSLAETAADLERRLSDMRREAGGSGQEAMDRDLEVHRLTARLRTLRRFDLDLCLGRVVPEQGDPVYVGRLGLTARDGRRLLVDWRSPAAEPFFGATHADPMGLVSRRRYRWTGGRITDYWDEVFTAEALAHPGAALDDQSAFIASLGSSRSARMRDVLGTIQADQDAIIRAGSRGALVVDGGPGTGKTVVALHRTAYLLYADPRLGHRRGGVLFVGPHQPYLAYVADVLPSLGEEGVQTCTLRDLVPGAADLPEETDPEVARLKARAAMVDAIEPAVRLYEERPAQLVDVETPWGDVRLVPADWEEAFEAADPDAPHNEARDEIWDGLVAVIGRRLAEEDPELDVDHDALRRALARNDDLAAELDKAWTLIDPYDLVADLWEVPAYLRMCAPWLTPEQRALLRRDDPRAWTVSDLPLLDAARRRLGDPDASRRRQRREAAIAAQAEDRAQVVEHLVASDDSEMMVMSMLKVADLEGALVDRDVVDRDAPDLLAGPFAHVLVDEAQELTDAEWQMVLSRCPSRSLTVVGDRAQARHGFTESWQERLARVGLSRVEVASLTINYRTPAEVMTAAEPVIRAVLPDANVPTSVRSTGVPVRQAGAAELGDVVAGWLAGRDEGVACVITVDPASPEIADLARHRDRVSVLTPELAKGLEFDLVVLVDPDRFGTGIEGGVDRYVAMTRATQELVVVDGHNHG